MKDTKFDQTDFFKIGFYISAIFLIWNMPNLGNNLMPRNFMGWFGIIVISSILLIYTLIKGKLLLSNIFLLLAVPVIAVLLHGVIIEPSTSMDYYRWLIAGAIFGFSLFLIALLQVKDSNFVWIRFSNLLLIILCFQTLISDVFPVFKFGLYLINFFPIELRAANGGFQQANLLASFVSSLILWSWTLKIRHEVTDYKNWTFQFVVTFYLGFIIFQTGSRSASLGLLIGVLLVSLFLYRKKASLLFFLPVLALLLALVFDYSGGIGASRKGDMISAVKAAVDFGGNTSIRLVMWEVAYLAGLESWPLGAGLGSFSTAFYDTYALKSISNDNWRFISSLAHPHNEFLMQWVEMGFYGLIFVVLPILFFIWKLIFSYSFSVLLILSALMPIAIHTQTEMVLHASGYHWLLVGLMLASLTHRNWLSSMSIFKSFFVLPLFFGLGASWVTLSAAIESKNAWVTEGFARSAKNLGVHLKRLTNGTEMHHWIHKTAVNDRIIKKMMAVALNSNNKQAVKKFLPRLIDQNNRWQERESWILVAQAYLTLGNLHAYQAHMNKIKTFDPVFASSLEKQFNVKATN